MSSNVLDYFCMLGASNVGFEPIKLEGDPDEPNDDVEPKVAWQDAVTDLGVYFPGIEIAPEDQWEFTSTEGMDADQKSGMAPKLMLQRRRHTDKPNHITDIIVLQKNEALPKGFELLQTSISGANMADFNVNSIHITSFIAFRRCVNDCENFVKGKPFIDDVLFVNVSLGEQAPLGYEVVERNINKGGPAGTDEVYLSYRRRRPMGICDMAYRPHTLDRFPRKDHPGGMELTETELPLFAFPNGMHFKYRKMEDYPLPDFFSFVFTDATGGHLYAACLRFYEVADRAKVEELFDDTFSAEDGTKLFDLSYGSNMQILHRK